ncbi:hypothetical protein B0H15DRAFT_953240 [Mycena belliarum]|uniref:Uncharacterized protein n=1 Tax=Mycena belliarum TaxID=1033014 RepID=A0AAD6U0T2_9AGAR|nr:hypothetical protein B0H15DRAFT_953240 [Mycena belliae]
MSMCDVTVTHRVKYCAVDIFRRAFAPGHPPGHWEVKGYFAEKERAPGTPSSMATGEWPRAGSSKKAKKRSPAQKLQSKKLTQKENIPPVPIVAKSAPKPVVDHRHELDKAKRKIRHLTKKNQTISDENSGLKITSKTRELAFQKARLSYTAGLLRAKAAASLAADGLSKADQKLLAVNNTNTELKGTVRALQKRMDRSVGVLSRAVDRAWKKPLVRRITQRGIFTVEARKIARTMAAAGCSRGSIGPLLRRVAEIFGIKVDREMSRRTAGRVILEGGVATKMQVQFELARNPGITISADSTSNCGINFESAHIACRVPDYASGSTHVDPKSQPKLRLTGVHSTVDHSSADLNGMCGDHVSAEKGTAKGTEGLKHEAVVEDLSEKALVSKSMSELVLYLSVWNAKKIAEAGGTDAWDRLSELEKAERDAKLMKEIVEVLGKAAYSALSPEERRKLDLFIWAGCCMHKDLNSFRGGNAEMMLEYPHIPGAVPPIILANKGNAAILKELLEPGSEKYDNLTELQQKAFESSTRGAIKTCAIAGMIFNNKDGKKGQGDKHVDFMTAHLGKPQKRFPGTHNSRFSSSALAAAELIKNLSIYSPALTNVENDLRLAIRDPATLTELVVVILYYQSVGHPYMRVVRGPGTENTNVLDLGPLHVEVCSHIRTMIDDPSLIMGSDTSHLTGSLDGQLWEDPEAMNAALALVPTLPHVREILLAFLRGALATWIRFSAEFAPGGLIDLASATEKEAAWMPSTNDANEGALGSYRVRMRDKPSMSLHQYNAEAMYWRNDTQLFMDVVFEMPDHLFVMREARQVDASGCEAAWRQELVDFRVRLAKLKEDREQAKQQKVKEDREKILATPLLRFVANIYARGMTIPKITAQLDVLRLRGVPDILPNNVYEAGTDVKPEDPPPTTVSVRPATPGIMHTTNIPPVTRRPRGFDVLRTLLTVAAAATTASLFTSSGSMLFLPHAVPAPSPPSTSTSSTRRTPWSVVPVFKLGVDASRAHRLPDPRTRLAPPSSKDAAVRPTSSAHLPPAIPQPN